MAQDMGLLGITIHTGAPTRSIGIGINEAIRMSPHHPWKDRNR